MIYDTVCYMMYYIPGLGTDLLYKLDAAVRATAPVTDLCPMPIKLRDARSCEYCKTMAVVVAVALPSGWQMNSTHTMHVQTSREYEQMAVSQLSGLPLEVMHH